MLRKWSPTPELELLIDDLKSKAISNKPSLPNFNRFIGQFMPAEVKREIIELIDTNDGIHLLKIVYFTNYHHLTKDLIFDRKNSIYQHNLYQYSSFTEKPKVTANN